MITGAFASRAASRAALMVEVLVQLKAGMANWCSCAYSKSLVTSLPVMTPAGTIERMDMGRFEIWPDEWIQRPQEQETQDPPRRSRVHPDNAREQQAGQVRWDGRHVHALCQDRSHPHSHTKGRPEACRVAQARLQVLLGLLLAHRARREHNARRNGLALRCAAGRMHELYGARGGNGCQNIAGNAFA